MSDIHSILKQYWGFDQFRPLQQEIIESVLSGKDTLALLPTGGGKSICFQVPALAIPGVCIVVSPLIALMKDQVYNLNKRGIKASAIYSGLPNRVIDILLDNAVLGKTRFLYLSPERLASEDFRARLVKMKVNLLAVDEAHCISQWGYDFRPPYLQIAEIRAFLPNVPVIALTATATPKVADDIQVKLLFKQSHLLQKSFVRPNLSYVVREANNKEESLLDILNKVPGTAVVYVRNRKATKTISDYLNKHKIKADYYHAGLEPNIRSKKQDEWMMNKTRVICCTNAFGMGIDKADVRVVVHLDLADSLEAYFQEAGRAGRDEKKAYAVLLVNEADKQQLRKNIETGFPTLADLREIYDALGQFLHVAYTQGANQPFDFAVEMFSDKFHIPATKALASVKILAQQGILYTTDSVFSLSQVKCICSKDTLVRFQDQNNNLEPLVKFILRTSEGVFEDFCPIDEDVVASRLKLTVSDTVKQLQDLNRFAIFRYEPRKNKPQLIFLQNRVKKDELRLDNQQLKNRKSDYESRLKATLNYITDKDFCRTKLLVKYFGEEVSDDCGICDVCVQKKQHPLPVKELEILIQHIEAVLRQDPMNSQELQQHLKLKNRDLKTAIDYLEDHRLIERTAGNKLKWV